MPEWLKKLLKALKVDAALFKVNVENLTVVNTPASPPTFSYDKTSGKAEINLAGMTPEQIKATIGALREAFFEDKQAFIDSRSSERVLELRAVEGNEKNKRILDAFKPIIAAEDFQALRAALFLRAEYDAGRDVHILKQEVMTRFGARGARIANLCSAGYFDNFPAELEAAMKKADFSYEKVRKYFERFVEQSGYAIFVRSSDSEAATRKEITEKICANATYGLGRLVVHGIGKENVKKIEGVVDALIKKHPRIQRQSSDYVGHTANISLSFPTDIVKELK